MNRTGTKILETERLILRRFREDDAEDMFSSWASDPEVTRFLTWPAHQDVSVSRKILRDWIGRYGDGSYFNWAIEWRETGRVVGNISVVRLDETIGSAEIGYCLGRAYWGRGIMPEALRAVIDYLFDTAAVTRAAACHDVNNPKSGRVMEKAGMKREGILRSAGVNNSGICDLVWYSVVSSDRGERREHPAVNVRFAAPDDAEPINRLRRQVNSLHVAGRPETFKPGFCRELEEYIHEILTDPQKKVAVAEADGRICGYAVLNHIVRPENPFMYERDFLDIDEFGVDESVRRQGIASGMIRFICDYARQAGFARLELNMWEFNEGALAFYQSAGFETYRRYMEMKL